VKLFGSHHRKAFGQIEAHLVAKDGDSSSPGSIGFLDALFKDFPHQIVILTHRLIQSNNSEI
jgi:hypothetical protein